MNIDKTDIGSWVRYFRLAKTAKTLSVMSERWIANHPEYKVMITIATNHRNDEIMAGRLLEVSGGR